MKRLFLKLVEAILRKKYGNKAYYSFFYFLYLQGLKGMDHGYSYIFPDTSGEYSLLEKVAAYYNAKAKRIVFFDVGANTGYFAKKVLEIFNGNIDVYCFEPSSFTYQKLIETLGNSVRSYKFALSNRVGESTLHADADGSGMASIVDTTYAPPFGISPTKHERITTETIDQFCEKNSIEKVHFLKMDVEGHEYSILEGAQKKLSEKSFDFIQFEFGRINIDSGVPLKKFYKILHDAYDIYRIINTGLVPQFEYNYEYEIYLGTNFLAVNKLLSKDPDLNIIFE
ncbi:MAG TPA: FkbM family methyltransferase [Chryseolinea sp.]|nr:FkbM family methyltransferase [Chryseolinea sp.]